MLVFSCCEFNIVRCILANCMHVDNFKSVASNIFFSMLANLFCRHEEGMEDEDGFYHPQEEQRSVYNGF